MFILEVLPSAFMHLASDCCMDKSFACFFLIPLLGIAICAHGFAHKFIFVPYDWGGMKGLASIQALQRDKTKTVFFTKFWATSASLLLSYLQRSAKRHNIRTLTSKNYTCCTFWGF